MALPNPDELDNTLITFSEGDEQENLEDLLGSVVYKPPFSSGSFDSPTKSSASSSSGEPTLLRLDVRSNGAFIFTIKNVKVADRLRKRLHVIVGGGVSTSAAASPEKQQESFPDGTPISPEPTNVSPDTPIEGH